MGLRQEKVSVRHKIFPANAWKFKNLPFELEKIFLRLRSAIFDAKVVRYLGSQSRASCLCNTTISSVAMIDRFNSSHLSMDILTCEGVVISVFWKWNEPIPQRASGQNVNSENEYPQNKSYETQCCFEYWSHAYSDHCFWKSKIDWFTVFVMGW